MLTPLSLYKVVISFLTDKTLITLYHGMKGLPLKDVQLRLICHKRGLYVLVIYSPLRLRRVWKFLYWTRSDVGVVSGEWGT